MIYHNGYVAMTLSNFLRKRGLNLVRISSHIPSEQIMLHIIDMKNMLHISDPTYRNTDKKAITNNDSKNHIKSRVVLCRQWRAKASNPV